MAFLQLPSGLLGDFLEKSFLGVTLAILGRRMKRIPELLAESISRSASLVARKLHSILLWPPQIHTSPSSTSLKVRLSLPDLTTRFPPRPFASIGFSWTDHIPLSSARLTKFCDPKLRVTLEPGADHPQTWMGLSLCRIIPSPKILGMDKFA